MWRQMRVEVAIWARSRVSVCHQLDRPIPTFDTRPLGQVIHNHLARVDVIIDEWYSGLRTISTKNRNPGQAESCRTYHLLCAIRPEFRFLLLHGYKFRIDSHQHSCPRKFVRMKEVMFYAAGIAIAKKSFQFLVLIVGDGNAQRDITVTTED